MGMGYRQDGVKFSRNLCARSICETNTLECVGLFSYSSLTIELLCVQEWWNNEKLVLKKCG